MTDNCKVHFAGYDNQARAISILRAAGVNYRLFSAYSFIKNKAESYAVPNMVENVGGFKHVIVDSGLFTLMWGGGKDKGLTEADLRDWMHRLVRFATENDIRNASFVECDCQKLAGPELAWELRQEMKELLPNRSIINVFHLEDGQDGFERLVKFTDYLAISVPELRFNQGGRYKNTVCALSRLAKQIKPTVKIHLLGCTEIDLLRKNRFCTSSDSSTWTASARWGRVDKQHHISEISFEKAVAADELMSEKSSELGLEVPPPTDKRIVYNAGNYYSIRIELQKYERACGPQD